MLKVQKLPESERRRINLKLKPFGVEMNEATQVNGENKVWVGLETGCAATTNFKRIAEVIFSSIKGIFEIAPSAVVVEGREFNF